MTERRGPYPKSLARRDAILDAALKVFAASGYWSGSLESVAREVGVTKAALHYYFPNKGALFAAVLERRDKLALEISPLDPEDPVEALRGLLRLAAYNLETPSVVALHTVTSAEAWTVEHPAHKYTAQRYVFLLDRLTEILEHCREQGFLASHVEPARAARSIAAMWDGLQLQWLADPGSLDMVDDFARHIGDLLTPQAGW